MSLYDDDVLESNKDGSRTSVFIRRMNRLILFISWQLGEFDQITSRIDSCEEISSATTTTIQSRIQMQSKIDFEKNHLSSAYFRKIYQNIM